MELDFLISNLFLLLGTILAFYIFFRILFRKTILNLFDPLHIEIILISFYSVIFSIPFYITVGKAYWIILVLFILYFVSASLSGRINKYKPPFLKTDQKAQITLSIMVFIILALNLIINVLFGAIPLLIADGVNSRYLMNQNSRILWWLSQGLFILPLLLMAFSESRKVKVINLISVIIIVAGAILSASKGSFILIPLLMINYLFLKKIELKKISPRFYKVIYGIGFIFLITFPLFLVKIGFAESGVEGGKKFLIRLATGFDQLIFWIISDAEPKSYGLSLLQIYFLPIFKVFGFVPEYNTTVEYLGINYLGWDTVERMIPNANLILDAVFTNGLLLGGAVIVLIAILGFKIRKYCLEKSSLNLYHLFLFQFFVMSPLFWFLDGQRFVASLYSAFLIYFIFAIVYNVPYILFKGKIKTY